MFERQYVPSIRATMAALAILTTLEVQALTRAPGSPAPKGRQFRGKPGSRKYAKNR